MGYREPGWITWRTVSCSRKAEEVLNSSRQKDLHFFFYPEALKQALNVTVSGSRSPIHQLHRKGAGVWGAKNI